MMGKELCSSLISFRPIAAAEESSALEAHLVEVGAANDTASAERAACLDSLDACEEDYSSLLLSCA